MAPAWYSNALTGIVIMVAFWLGYRILHKGSAPPDVANARPLALVVTRFGAIAYAALNLLGTVVVIIQTLISDSVAVALPVASFWPGAYPWVTITDGPTAQVTGGGFSIADVTVDGLDLNARLWLAAGHAAQGLTFIVVAIVIAILCNRLLGGNPFRPFLTRAVTGAAAAIGIGGIAWQVFFQIGGNAASQQVLAVTGWNSKQIGFEGYTPDSSTFDATATGLPAPGMGFTVEFWPIFLALALLAVAAAFRYSASLQRDTQGLV